jgi:hypothetical protein
MEQKNVIELKMLAIILVTNLNDLQTHIFQFIILINVFRVFSLFICLLVRELLPDHWPDFHQIGTNTSKGSGRVGKVSNFSLMHRF